MQLFKKKPSPNATLAELEAYYGVKRGGETSGTARSAVLASVVVLIGAALIFGLFLGGRGIYRAIKNDDSTDTATTQSTDKTKADEAKTSGSSSTGTTNPSASSTTNTSSTSTSTASTQPSTQTESLPNTGPDADL